MKTEAQIGLPLIQAVLQHALAISPSWLVLLVVSLSSNLAPTVLCQIKWQDLDLLEGRMRCPARRQDGRRVREMITLPRFAAFLMRLQADRKARAGRGPFANCEAEAMLDVVQRPSLPVIDWQYLRSNLEQVAKWTGRVEDDVLADIVTKIAADRRQLTTSGKPSANH